MMSLGDCVSRLWKFAEEEEGKTVWFKHGDVLGCPRALQLWLIGITV